MEHLPVEVLVFLPVAAFTVVLVVFVAHVVFASFVHHILRHITQRSFGPARKAAQSAQLSVRLQS